MNDKPCNIVIYGSDTVCHKCGHVWDTGDDFPCPYIRVDVPKPKTALCVMLAIIAGLCVAFYNAIRWLG